MNLFEETLFAVNLYGLDGEMGLKFATLCGARALGIADETGSLEPGKWADCTVIRMTGTGETPAERVLASSPDDVLRTYVGGMEVHSSE